MRRPLKVVDGIRRAYNGFTATVALCAALSLMAVTIAACGSSTTEVGPITGIEALWVANGTNVVEYNAFTGGNFPAPVVINSGGSSDGTPFGSTQGVLFTSAGDQWVIDGGTTANEGSVAPALDLFIPVQLTGLVSDPNPSASVTLRSPSFGFPQQAALDSSGNMWVSDNLNNQVYEFTADQLSAGGTAVTPNITINSLPAFDGALGIAVSNGNLYVANNTGDTIYGFAAETIPTTPGTYTLVPTILSSNEAGSISGPWALTFDALGDLWVSNEDNNTVVQFAASSLGTTGSPDPVTTLTATSVGGVPTINGPTGIAFDSSGNLAIANGATPLSVGFFDSDDLSSGSPEPQFLFTGSASSLIAPAGTVLGPLSGGSS